MLPDPSSVLLIALLSLPQPASAAPSSPLPVFRFVTATPPPPSALTRGAGPRPLRHPVAKKATAAVAGAILGFFVGISAGAAIGSLGDDEYGPLTGMAVGAPIGTLAGGFLALRWAR